MNIKSELMQLRREFGVLHAVSCSAEENEAYRKLLSEKKPLPNGVFQKNEKLNINDADIFGNATFIKLCKTDVISEEVQEYLAYKKLAYLKTLKDCVVFFTVLAVISLVAGLFFAFSL